MILSSKEKVSLFRGIITTNSMTSYFLKTSFSSITPSEPLQKMTSMKKESRGQLFTHHHFNVCLVIRDDNARKSIDAKIDEVIIIITSKSERFSFGLGIIFVCR